MNSDIMKDFTNKLSVIGEEFNRIISDNSNKFDLANFQKIFNEAFLKTLKVDKPRIMMYGIYNSGKSTLLNSIVGSAVAPMGDIPVTSKITEYDMPGYTIVDAPGVDAPIEHEKVSKAFMKKCHIILYVISNKGTHESAKNYSEMSEILSLGKELIIVMNDKMGVSGDNINDNIPAIRNDKLKIIENLYKLVGADKIRNKFTFVVVNAFRALDGILKNKSGMVDKSNLAEVKAKIVQTLREIEAYKMFKPAVNILREFINLFEGRVMEVYNENSKRDFGLEFKKLEDEREAAIDNVNLRIKTLIVESESRLIESIMAEKNNQQSVLENFNKTLSADIEKIIMDIIEETEEKLKKCELYSSVDFNISVSRADISNILFEKVESDEENKGNISENDKEESVEGSEKSDFSVSSAVNAAGLAAGKLINPKMISSMLPSGIAKTSLPLIGTVGKFLPKFLPPIIPIATTILSFLLSGDDGEAEFRAEKRQAEKENMQRQAAAMNALRLRSDIRSKIRNWLFEIEPEQLASARKYVIDLFNIAREQLVSNLKMEKGELDRLRGILDNISALKSSIETVESEMK